jgi:hypothetical protein
MRPTPCGGDREVVGREAIDEAHTLAGEFGAKPSLGSRCLWEVLSIPVLGRDINRLAGEMTSLDHTDGTATSRQASAKCRQSASFCGHLTGAAIEPGEPVIEFCLRGRRLSSGLPEGVVALSPSPPPQTAAPKTATTRLATNVRKPAIS